jgi:tRNA nucleotidyltransferase (CCA-adding enzyme)
MSDYIFMLESHLNAPRMAALNEVQAAANEANIPVFLTGAALRDMLGGFPIQELDFTVEGNAASLAKSLAKKTKAVVTATDPKRNLADVQFPSGVVVRIGMARTETYPKPASKPVIKAATIHDDLLCRDFTINAIAMSLNPQSRGLLIDPTNGMGDLNNRELRVASKYALYDDPSRILRLFRYRVRMGFTFSEKTQNQYEYVREAKLEKKIPSAALGRELRSIAKEANSAEIVKLLDDEKLLTLFCPALTGAKVNHAGLQKLHKAISQVPLELRFPVDNLSLFLSVLCEKLSPRERSLLAQTCSLTRPEVLAWNKLEASAKKLEKSLKAANLTKPSKIFAAAQKGAGEQVLYVLYKSDVRLVNDRIKNYLQKYLMVAHEMTDADFDSEGIKPGTPKYEKARLEALHKRLDARPKKVVEPPPPPPMAAPIVSGARRASAQRG